MILLALLVEIQYPGSRNLCGNICEWKGINKCGYCKLSQNDHFSKISKTISSKLD